MKKILIFLVLIFSTTFMYSSDLKVGLIASYELETFLQKRCDYIFENWKESAYLTNVNYNNDYNKHLRSSSSENDFVYKKNGYEVRLLDRKYLGYTYDDYLYLLEREDLDLLIYTANSNFSQLSESDIYLVDRASLKKVSSLIEHGAKLEDNESVLIDFVSYLYPEAVLIDVSSLPSLSSVIIEGEVVTIFKDKILLLDSDTRLKINSPSYIEWEGKVDGDKLLVNLEKIDYPPIAITTVPYDARLSFMSNDINKLPLYIDDRQDDIVFSVSKDGYATSSYQLHDFESSLLTIDLKPAVLSQSSLLEENRVDMYSSLTRFLISVACSSLTGFLQGSNVVPPNVPIDVFSGLSIGCSIITFIDFMKNCSDYYNSAKNIYL